MKLAEVLEQFDSTNDEIKEKAKEIKQYINDALNYFEDIDDEDFIDGKNRDFTNGMDEVANAQYAIGELIDDLLE